MPVDFQDQELESLLEPPEQDYQDQELELPLEPPEPLTLPDPTFLDLDHSELEPLEPSDSHLEQLDLPDPELEPLD